MLKYERPASLLRTTWFLHQFDEALIFPAHETPDSDNAFCLLFFRHSSPGLSGARIPPIRCAAWPHTEGIKQTSFRAIRPGPEASAKRS